MRYPAHFLAVNVAARVVSPCLNHVLEDASAGESALLLNLIVVGGLVDSFGLAAHGFAQTRVD